jgi:hypothetical protein
MLRAILCLAAVLLLAGCDINERRMMLLKCGNTPLDQDYKCPNIVKKGSVMSLLVNPATQKVQLTVLESNADFTFNTTTLEDCSVVDKDNWKCRENWITGAGDYKTTFNTTYGMVHGHFYHMLTSNRPPEFYSSSVGGWRLWMVDAGILNYEQAQQYE